MNLFGWRQKILNETTRIQQEQYMKIAYERHRRFGEESLRKLEASMFDVIDGEARVINESLELEPPKGDE